MDVSDWQVREALRPRLGSSLVDDTPLCAGIASLLRCYAPYRDTLAELEKRLESYLFDGLYTLLGDSMAVMLDDERVVRIRMRELPELADDAMGALFEAMPVYSVNYQTLKDYSLRASSLSAMRVLLQKYDQYQSPEEKALMGKVIRERYPAARYQGWLKPTREETPPPER